LRVSRVAIVFGGAGLLAAIAVSVIVTLAFLPVADTSSAALASDQGTGLNEDVKVHGAWTIDVRESDGSLVRHREFDNSLSAVGKHRLADVLTRSDTAGGWAISLDGSPSPCHDSNNINRGCEIAEASNPKVSDSTRPDVFGTLIKSARTTVFQLDGYFIAQIDGTITSVITNRGSCLPAVSPQACESNPFAAAGSAQGAFSSQFLSP